MVTQEQLQQIMPNLALERVQTFLPWLNKAMDNVSINTPLRIAYFLAQIAHESGELRWWLEQDDGMNYDITVNPHLAAILGNTQPGDGPKYKGRSPIQLTGRSNYTNCGSSLGIDLVNSPELAEMHEHGFDVTTWYWSTHNLNEYADNQDFLGLTQKINGGLTGEDDREKYLAVAKQVLQISS